MMNSLFASTPAYQAFVTLNEYHSGLDLVIATATKELIIFDGDLRDMALEDVLRADALRMFLAGGIHRRLRVVLRDALYLHSHAPRMQRLLRDFSAQIEVRVVAEVKESDAFTCNDSGVCLTRPHYQHPKSILTLDDKPRWHLLSSRFELMFAAVDAVVAATHLGL
ncbi:MAG: hypothetical protein ABL868_02710 [Sulfuriferula sp.]